MRKSASLEALRWRDVVDDAVLVLERLGRLAVGPLVLEVDLEALVEEGHDLEPLDHGLGPELDLLEDRRVGPERHGGAGAAAGRLARHLELARGLAPVDELHDVVVAVAVDLEDQAGRQGVDHRAAHAVEAAGDLVPAALAELAAGVEDGVDDLGRRLVLVLRVDAGRDAAAVVGHPHAAVGQEGHLDAVAVAGHGLVDGVVHDLPHQVVEPGRAGRPDVHARAACGPGRGPPAR